MHSSFRFAVVTVLVVFSFSCAGNALTPLPNDEPYTFKVLLIEDEELPRFSYREFIRLFDETIPRLAKERLDYDITVSFSMRYTLPEAYKRYRPSLEKKIRDFNNEYIDLAIGQTNALEYAIHLALKRSSPNQIESMLVDWRRGFATSMDDYQTLVLDSFYEAYNALMRAEITPGGRGVTLRPYRYIYAKPFWRIVGAHIRSFDLIIVNFPLASVGMSDSLCDFIHGGIRNGFVVPNPHTRTKGLGVITTYPITGADPYLQARRHAMPESAEEEVFAHLMLQQIATLLCRYAEIDGEENSIMKTPRGYAHYDWYMRLLDEPLRAPYKTLSEF